MQIEAKINPSDVCEASWLLIRTLAVAINDFLSPGGRGPVLPGTGARRAPAPNAQGAIPLKRGDPIVTPDFGSSPMKE